MPILEKATVADCARKFGGRVLPKTRSIDWEPEGRVLNKEALKMYKVARNDISKYNYALNFSSESGKATLKRLGIKSKAEVYRRISAARQKILTIKPTKDLHFDPVNNVYSKKRAELHDRIVTHLVKDGTVAAPGEARALLTGGLPGSGKSSMMKSAVYMNRPYRYVKLDSDRIKRLLARVDGIPKLTYQAGAYHAESNDILNRALKRAVAENRYVLYDGTMHSEGKIIKALGNFKKAGYYTEAAFADLPMEKSIERAVARFLGKEGRFVDPIYVASNGTHNINNFNKLKKEFSEWRHWNTDVPYGETAKLKAAGGAA